MKHSSNFPLALILLSSLLNVAGAFAAGFDLILLYSYRIYTGSCYLLGIQASRVITSEINRFSIDWLDNCPLSVLSGHSASII